MPKPLAIACTMSFGDCLFSTPLTKMVAGQNPGGTTAIAVNPPHRDAYYNLPWIKHIAHTAGELQLLGYRVLDVSPCNYFEHYRQTIPNFSLIDTHLERARGAGLPGFNQQPIFLPTPAETLVAQQFVQGQELPLLALEGAYFSGQSWCQPEHILQILNHYGRSHKILWLSHTGLPDHPAVTDCSRFSRRELICLLNYCDLFYSVGSGFFCASCALQPGPKRTVCMWIDEYYRYEQKFSKLGFKVDWVHNKAELLRTFV